MNTTIAKLFEKTADALLVDKHLSKNIGENPVSVIMLSGKQEELLAAAKLLEESSVTSSAV